MMITSNCDDANPGGLQLILENTSPMVYFAD